jgi:hypothetical protein
MRLSYRMLGTDRTSGGGRRKAVGASETSRGLCKWWSGTSVIAAIACILGFAACAGAARTAPSQLAGVQGAQVVDNEEVILFPYRGAGAGGWCATTINRDGGCPSFRLPVFQGPIILEDWTGRSSSSEAPVDEAIVLTSDQVSAIVLDGRAPVATRRESGLPNGMRAAVVELRGGSRIHVFGVTAPPPFPRSHFVALDAAGHPIPQTRQPGPPLEFQVPARNWERGKKAPTGVCGLVADGPAGLLFEGGSVMTAAVPHRDIRGREFVDCVHTTYLLLGFPVEADVLVDAAHPGSFPAQLPAMRALRGHPGVFRGPGVNGETVARRVPGAWLLVTKGGSLKQRLLMLRHLRVSVHP